MNGGELWTGFLVGLAGVAVGVGGTLLVLFLSHRPLLTPGGTFGRFHSFPATQLLPDGRKLQLLDDFVYTDPRGKVWVARKDEVVDGASIPQAFWSFIGGPLEGQYRNASIIHDVECDRRGQAWEAVHQMFYEGCRCGGVGELKAKVLYAAVYHFGPRWVIEAGTKTVTRTNPASGKAETVAVATSVARSYPARAAVSEAYLKDCIQGMEKYVRAENPSLDQLRAIDPDALPK